MSETNTLEDKNFFNPHAGLGRDGGPYLDEVEMTTAAVNRAVRERGSDATVEPEDVTFTAGVPAYNEVQLLGNLGIAADLVGNNSFDFDDAAMESLPVDTAVAVDEDGKPVEGTYDPASGTVVEADSSKADTTPKDTVKVADTMSTNAPATTVASKSATK